MFANGRLVLGTQSILEELCCSSIHSACSCGSRNRFNHANPDKPQWFHLFTLAHAELQSILLFAFPIANAFTDAYSAAVSLWTFFAETHGDGESFRRADAHAFCHVCADGYADGYADTYADACSNSYPLAASQIHNRCFNRAELGGLPSGIGFGEPTAYRDRGQCFLDGSDRGPHTQ